MKTLIKTSFIIALLVGVFSMGFSNAKTAETNNATINNVENTRSLRKAVPDGCKLVITVSSDGTVTIGVKCSF